MTSLLPRAKVFVIKNYLNDSVSNLLLDFSQKELNWTNYVTRFGVKAKRLHWIGGYDYNFSGVTNLSEKFPDFIESIINKINKEFSLELNSCYANLYKDNTVSLGYHTDSEKQLVKTHSIVSLSLGKSRRLWFKDIKTGEEISVILGHGDLLIMSDDSQTNYLHSVKSDKDLENGVRVSLTFRKFK